MRLLEETAVEIPRWARIMFVVLAAAFGGLAVWLVSMLDGSWLPAAAATASALLALLLLVTAIRGRLWRWMWLLPWVSPG